MELPNIPYRVSHRDVKYPRIEFKTGNLLLILPFGFKPVPLLEKHRSWILKKTGFIKECLKETRNKQIVERTEKQFRDLIYSFVKGASKELGGELNNIYFRTMKTKWASCSAKRNLTINKLMKYLPEHLVKYVIFHEMIHLEEIETQRRILEENLKEIWQLQRIGKGSIYILVSGGKQGGF